MATKVISGLHSLRKEGHILPLPFPPRFHVLLGPYSTGLHGTPNPRSLVISNTRLANLPEHVSLLTVSYLNTKERAQQAEGASGSRAWPWPWRAFAVCPVKQPGLSLVLNCACLKPTSMYTGSGTTSESGHFGAEGPW